MDQRRNKLYMYHLAKPDQENPDFALPVGTMLQGRYLVGSMEDKNCWTQDYQGWDEQNQKKVRIREFYPHYFAHRNTAPGNLQVNGDGDYGRYYDGYVRESMFWHDPNA